MTGPPMFGDLRRMVLAAKASRLINEGKLREAHDLLNQLEEATPMPRVVSLNSRRAARLTTQQN
jgi:hypothetical protein